jgi:hypothetical protein
MFLPPRSSISWMKSPLLFFCFLFILGGNPRHPHGAVYASETTLPVKNENAIDDADVHQHAHARKQKETLSFLSDVTTDQQRHPNAEKCGGVMATNEATLMVRDSMEIIRICPSLLANIICPCTPSVKFNH